MNKKRTKSVKDLDVEEVRQAVADLIGASGCSCCRDDRNWYLAEQRLAKMLHVKEYADKSGYDFNRYSSDPV